MHSCGGALSNLGHLQCFYALLTLVWWKDLRFFGSVIAVIRLTMNEKIK